VKLSTRPSSAEVKECVELFLLYPNTFSWRGAQLKQRDSLTFTFMYLVCSVLSGLCNCINYQLARVDSIRKRQALENVMKKFNVELRVKLGI